MAPTGRFSQVQGLGTVWLALGVCVTSHAQGTTLPPGASNSTPLVAPSDATAALPAGETPAPPKHDRLVSDKLAATLASTMPKYLPPAPGTENDQPKNGIIRLERYVVKESRPPVFTERQIHTKKGLAEIAMKRHRGLGFGNLFGMNESVALQMYEEQERLDNLAEMADAAKNARNAGDSAGARDLLRERTRAAFRPSGIGGNRGK